MAGFWIADDKLTNRFAGGTVVGEIRPKRGESIHRTIAI
tara:strand:+ start:20442 stop:20558 length:117 start_codon:yes stop_codon:yes gene_type:complete